jgi:AraC-like DNA-binding protein
MYGHFMPLFFLMGPFLYFYIRSIVGSDYKLTKQDWLHFIPFVVMLIGNLPYVFSNFSNKLILIHRIASGDLKIYAIHINLFFSDGVSLMLRNLILIGYNIASIRLFMKGREAIKSKMTEYGIQYRRIIIYIWMLLLSILFFIFISFTLLEFESKLLFYRYSVLWYWQIFNFRAFVFFVLTITLFFIPELVYGLPIKYYFKQLEEEGLSDSRQVIKEEAPEGIAEPEKDKLSYNQLMFTEEYVKEINEKMMNYLDLKPYLNPGFSQTNLSVAINIPVHHLSYYFNQVLKQKFTDWRNHLRVQHAKELIQNGKAEMFSLETISKECGFSNQTTFIKAFKQELQLTPSEFARSFK